MLQLNPYLNFDGQCREAMSFYQQCLGGDLTLQKIAESPMAAQMPANKGAQILHAMLKCESITLMGSDMMGNDLRNGNHIALCLNGDDEQEFQSLFNKLSAHASAILPLHNTFWGATYGEFVDQFHIKWMFSYTKS